MNFTPTQDQLDLKQGTKEFLTAVCTPEKLRVLRDTEDKNPLMWPQLAELGLLGFLASEANGGLGMNAVGFALVAEEAGCVALPEPLTAVAGVSIPVLNALGMADLCSAIAAGSQRVFTVHSLNPFVNQCRQGDQFLALSNREIRLHAGDEVKLTQSQSIDPLRAIYSVELLAEGQLLAAGRTGRRAYCAG